MGGFRVSAWVRFGGLEVCPLSFWALGCRGAFEGFGRLAAFVFCLGGGSFGRVFGFWCSSNLFSVRLLFEFYFWVCFVHQGWLSDF